MDNKLVNALRHDIALEEDAIITYTNQAEATDNIIVRKALLDIAAEERVHIGEFIRLIQRLTKDEAQLQLRGYDEIDKIIESFTPEEINKWLEK